MGLSAGSQSRAGQPQRGQRGFVGALWLYTGVGDFRNVRGINLEHWDPRERNGAQTHALVCWYSEGR